MANVAETFTTLRHFALNLLKRDPDRRIGITNARKRAGWRLREAAACNWADVEPAIFGTLLERALDPRERHSLGAHYTPRSYVERLVRPTIEEPLRADWDVVQAEARQLVAAGKEDAARKAVRTFHQKLCSVRVLDPACGSGNFLYVSLDLFKRLEGEVLAMLAGLGETQKLLHLETVRVTPAQFLGIEIKPWAKEIAELVLWIGYLQWHFKTYGKTLPVPEPVLRDYKNIEQRDAVLAYDRTELVLDEKGKPRTRWDGFTVKKNSVTGENVPDEAAQVPLQRYLNPRRTAWPAADFIVGNPPFVGTRRMRLLLGDGYVEALTQARPDVPENADYVMYWWAHAAELVKDGRVRRFGLITTNSINQTMNRAAIKPFLDGKPPLSILFAVPDHPWVDSATCADVRIAMTVGAAGEQQGRLVRAIELRQDDQGEVEVAEQLVGVGRIREDLRAGASPAAAVPLQANAGVAYWGVKFYGDGFILKKAEADALKARDGKGALLRPFVSGKDLTGKPRGLVAIDCDGLDESGLRRGYPATYEHLLARVKPVRAHNPRAFKRERWWIFGENQPGMRKAVAGLPRYIATTETAKHRVFHFLEALTLAEGTVAAIALADAFYLGVLSSRIHVTWALAAGGRLGIGNDPRYNKTRCFDTFPFPVCDEVKRNRIRVLAEELDAHHKKWPTISSALTTTTVYNVLDKVQKGETLTAADRQIAELSLISTLGKLHKDLDAAVLDAYGWPQDLSDEQILDRLVKLNAERAEEERNGVVRWLRPEFQNPAGKRREAQAELDTAEESEEEAVAPAAAAAWPRKLAEQIAAVRDLLLGSPSPWTVKQVAKRFKQAKTKEVEAVLESLTALGLLVEFQPNGEVQYQAARSAAA